MWENSFVLGLYKDRTCSLLFSSVIFKKFKFCIASYCYVIQILVWWYTEWENDLLGRILNLPVSSQNLNSSLFSSFPFPVLHQGDNPVLEVSMNWLVS